MNPDDEACPAVFQSTSNRLYLADIMAPERNSFGVLRCLMAALVLISHSYMFQTGTSAAEPIKALTGWSLGQHGVQVFFFLSGLMVAQSFERSRGVVDFTIARVLRIFPGLIVCVLLTALVLGPVFSTLAPSAYFSSSALVAYVVKTLSLSTGAAPLPGVFESVPLANRVNTSLWTLKYEVVCYVLLATGGLAGLFRGSRWNVWLLTAGLAALAAFVTPPPNVEDYGFSDNVRYFALFFAPGVAAYMLRDRLLISAWALIPLAALFVVALGSQFAELATALLLGYAAIWLASKTFGSLRGTCNRLDLSFGIYIYAGPIQQTLLDTVPGIEPLGLTVLAFLIVVPLAILSWVLVEKPSMGLRSQVRAMLDVFVTRASPGKA
jgi:peptidoglycan/LPS O-acetylase OafA/YrhL